MRLKLIFIILVFFEVGFSFPSNEKEPRDESEFSGMEPSYTTEREKQRPQKRSSLDFAAMTLCKTGRNPLDYNGYGCWCGLGGKGKPVDEIDQCCYVHDKCYDDIVDRGTCGWFSEYTIYAIVYWRSGCTGCGSWWNSNCQKALCECDAAAVRCWKENDSKFKNSYKNYDTSSC